MTDKQYLFDLPFEKYIEIRTRFAFARAARDNLITIDGAGLALLQAQWAREYWYRKNDVI